MSAIDDIRMENYLARMKQWLSKSVIHEAFK